MKLNILVLLFYHLLHSVQAGDIGKSFCPSTWPKSIDIANDVDEPASIFLDLDNSGCVCKEVPRKLVLCFGREFCKVFPKNITVGPDILRIKTTYIEVLKKEDLANLMHLRVLEIVANDYLNRLEPGVFLNMSNLRNLSVSYSENLVSLEPKVFEGLINLQQLSLIQNGFSDIRMIAVALSPSYLPKIYKISLSENVFREVEEFDLQPMTDTPLRELNLILCQIEYMHPNCLAPLQNLTALRLGANIFNTSTITDVIKSSIQQGIPLQLLNLYSVGFRKSPPKELLEAIANSKITNLCLARNQFEFLSENSFPEMPNLKVLDLREILALNLSSDVFKKMPNLRTLTLSGNKLSNVPDGVLLKQLTCLDLSSNSGNAFSPTYFTLGRKRFVDMQNLALLDLSFDRINGLNNGTFDGLTNLLVLGLKNASIFRIGNETFAMLNNLVFLNLENNPMGATQELNKEVFRGLNNLKVLLLGGCLILHLSGDSPFTYLKSLHHLGLERNRLYTISSDVFRPLKGLQSIDMSRNSFLAWQQRIFTENTGLRRVIVSQNRFTYLSEAMLDDFSALDSLDVSENPFTCECTAFITLIIRYRSDNGTIRRLLQQNQAFCVYPDSTQNLTVGEYLHHLQEYDINCDTYPFDTILVVAIPLAILLLATVLASVLIYRYRWHVRYWIFLARLQLSRSGKLQPKSRQHRSYTNYEYHAFVSYCNEDRNFVIRLVAMLESYEPFLKLCVYERDFQVGSIISESVLESVAKSRKTLLVISDSYARSQWCRWETQIAEHHRLFFENEHGEYVDDSLILIKLGPVCDSHLTPTLKYLLKTRIYLQWDADPKKQRAFWDKLRTTLSAPENEQETITC